MTDAPPTDLLVAARMRIAAEQGIPIVLRQRGDAATGALLLKINRLDGTARVLTQARLEDEVVWTPVSRTDPMSDIDAERTVAQHINIDPDLWVVEIEDRQGRPWFPGRVVRI